MEFEINYKFHDKGFISDFTISARESGILLNGTLNWRQVIIKTEHNIFSDVLVPQQPVNFKEWVIIAYKRVAIISGILNSSDLS